MSAGGTGLVLLPLQLLGAARPRQSPSLVPAAGNGSWAPAQGRCEAREPSSSRLCGSAPRPAQPPGQGMPGDVAVLPRSRGVRAAATAPGASCAWGLCEGGGCWQIPAQGWQVPPSLTPGPVLGAHPPGPGVVAGPACAGRDGGRECQDVGAVPRNSSRKHSRMVYYEVAKGNDSGADLPWVRQELLEGLGTAGCCSQPHCCWGLQGAGLLGASLAGTKQSCAHPCCLTMQ